MTTDDRYDVVLYGATGFVGQQTVQYFAQHALPGQVRWAIAGRNAQKLAAVQAQWAPGIDILVADSADPLAVAAMVRQARVLLNTAGPFARCGTGIVESCVRFQTHYVDITGETPWVKQLCDRYHDQAAADGTRIIPCCGFDSVPSDLGAYLGVQYLRQVLGVPCKAVKAYFQARGGFNGGTLASGFNLVDSGEAVQVGQPFLLNPPGEHTRDEVTRNQDPAWPQYDTDLETWVGPFFMGPVNTRVVRRSSGLFAQWHEAYGPNFTYQEYLKYTGSLAWFQAMGVTAGLTLLTGLLLPRPLRQLLQPYLPQPGSGPSEQTMDQGWFRCEILAIATDGRQVKGLIADQGDPGNRATVKFVCEAALSLALHPDELPGGPQRGGVLTPATGLGEVLIQRLRNQGMRIEMPAKQCVAKEPS